MATARVLSEVTCLIVQALGGTVVHGYDSPLAASLPHGVTETALAKATAFFAAPGLIFGPIAVGAKQVSYS